MNYKSHPRTLSPLKRAVHVCLLLGWLLSSNGVAPGLCLAAALVDGDHVVKVGASVEGEMTVVLSHAMDSQTSSYNDHDLLCSILMVFAQETPFGTRDHILAFKSVDDASRADRGACSVHTVAKLVPLPVFTLQPQVLAPVRAGAATHAPSPVWSPGLALQAGRMIMLC